MSMAAMAAAIWYFPGWMKASVPDERTLGYMTNSFTEAAIEFKTWDGDNIVWPLAVDSADKESWRFAFEIAMMPEKERESLTLAGHSLGGRIVARVLARLAENGLKVKQAVLMGAAIPSDDPDLEKMGRASILPVLAVCNPKDNVLRYVYATMGGERAVAFGANGTIKPCHNVVECVTPTNITKQVGIPGEWGKFPVLKEIANHHEKFYIEYAQQILDGNAPPSRVMVPQDFPTIEGRVTDSMFWWDVLDECENWKLEKNKLTGHCRIIDPGKKRTAWGRESELRAAFEKVKQQLAK